MQKKSLFIIVILIVSFYILGRIIYESWFDITLHFVNYLWGDKYTIVAKPEYLAYPYKRFGLYFCLLPLIIFIVNYISFKSIALKLRKTILQFSILFFLAYIIFCCSQFSSIFSVRNYVVNGKDISENARLVDLNIIYLTSLATAFILTIAVNENDKIKTVK